MLKQDNPNFYIIGTNEHPRSVLSTVCDEWYVEPVLKGNDYVEFCLSFCKEHQISVFMPRREMISISNDLLSLFQNGRNTLHWK